VHLPTRRPRPRVLLILLATLLAAVTAAPAEAVAGSTSGTVLTASYTSGKGQASQVKLQPKDLTRRGALQRALQRHSTYVVDSRKRANAADLPSHSARATADEPSLDLQQECLDQPEAENEFGWIKDHYTWCRRGQWHLILEDATTHQVVSEGSFDDMEVALGHDDSRTVTLYQIFTDPVSDNDGIGPQTTFALGYGCVNGDQASHCSVSPSFGVTHTLASLADRVVESFTATSDPGATTERDLVTLQFVRP
jgi:hypothetical protein